MRYFPVSRSKAVLLLTLLQTSLVYSQSTPQPISSGETPGSLACIYGFTQFSPGCRIKDATAVSITGSGAIAIIDGADDPNAATELAQFSNQFFPAQYALQTCNANNSNQPCFQQYYATGNSTSPCITAAAAGFHHHDYGIDESGDVEPEIDIEWAHAMAPKASIYMVETGGWLQTSDPSTPNTLSLINGLMCANSLLLTYNGGGIVSYSNSNQEWAGETAFDSYFQTPGIIYIASAGDFSAPARYPSTSPYVIAAGGTEIRRDSSGNYIEQIAWKEPVPICGPFGCKTGGTGGPSLFEKRPAYQNSVQKIVGTQRGTPDISFVAKNVDVFCCQIPSSGMYAGNNCCNVTGKPACQTVDNSLCTSMQGAWISDGGTSLAAPALAGIINSALSGATTSAQELQKIYDNAIKNYHAYWTDITAGNNGYPALTGYDFTSGLGVPRGYGGK